MKIKIFPKSGIMTLTLLIMLSSLLCLLLLFDDDNLRLHNTIVSQRQRYVADSQSLQQQSRDNPQYTCQQIPLQQTGNVYLVTLNSGRDESGLQQFFYCERRALFKRSPTKKTYEKQFDVYIDREKIAQFTPHFVTPQDGKQSIATQLYWFKEAEAKWEINSNVNGVIVAEGNLTVTGKGKISGTVILGGTLTLENVTLSYSKAKVTTIIQQFSEWQLAEKSWYDFKPL
ncbi:uncharacterized protein DUF2572 [Cricetibacter osteomyelitidis]|uniref:Uncharacterized protein DUF2572 n=1 Tax=Cricetibacter osteomyelitidis TaxID=1521931 RepID=A0A4R2SNM5_9PAST|nr:DUF2572 family protein [Cricetibacter osteomyelitidis]TCP89766.1 uncharacterized protein DUF2572 [Cricetibacter osteomyelitidis]